RSGGPRSKVREGPAGSTREPVSGGAGGVRGQRTVARGGRPRARGTARSTGHAPHAGPVAPRQGGGSDRPCRSSAGTGPRKRDAAIRAVVPLPARARFGGTRGGQRTARRTPAGRSRRPAQR